MDVHIGFLRKLIHNLLVVVGAASLTTIFFLVLPLIQAITETPVPDTLLTPIDLSAAPPPPEAPEDEPEPEEDQEEPPPELAESSQPLDLAQMELVLNPGFGGGLGGDFAVQLKALTKGSGIMDDIMSMTAPEQKPRPVHTPMPKLTTKLRTIRTGATVKCDMLIGADGRVQDIRIFSSTNPAFNKATLDALRKWRFEPAKRDGKPVAYRIRKPVTFPKG